MQTAGVFLALAEIRRSLGRFALLTAAVALLVLLLLFFQAVAGALTGGLTGAWTANAADVFVYDARARANPLASVLDPSVADAVAGVDGVAEAVAVGLTVTTATTADGEVDVALVGGVPGGPGFPATTDDGALPDGPGEALLGTAALEDTLAQGDVLTLGDLEVEVVGTADGAAFNVLPTLYVPADTYAEVVAARTGAPGDVPPAFVGVGLADGAVAEDVAAAIGEQVDAVTALTREAATEALPGVGQITQSFAILYLLLYVVVTIVTGVFFLILTVQKADALVLLRAVGARRRDVVTPVLVQVVAVVGLGALVGSGVAAGLLRLSRDTLGASLGAGTAATTVVAILILGLLAATGAVRRVLRIEPIAAVQGGA